MNGLSGARVLLLDDEHDAALPIVKALSKAGIPVAFFDGTKADLPKTNKKLRGVRLAILDMDLGYGGPTGNMASTLVGVFGQIIDRTNGPYGILIWTNHPDQKQKVAEYIYKDNNLPNPVFIEMLKKADFKKAGKEKNEFSIVKLSKALLRLLAENSPLECMQVWEGTCFHAATNVTNNVAELGTINAADLDEWRQAWREENLKLLYTISKARAEKNHTLENCISSMFLALDPLHSDRMDVLVENLPENLSAHANKIMAAAGGSQTERKAKVNTMLHLASDQLDTFNPGNLYGFARTKRPEFMPTIDEALQDCLEGKESLQKAVLQDARLCGLEVTPACDHAQNKMRISRIVAGVIVPWALQNAIKKNAAFLKPAGPFYVSKKAKLLEEGVYLMVFNSRYVVTAKPGVLKALPAIARVRASLLADLQHWVSYQASRQGVMMLT